MSYESQYDEAWKKELAKLLKKEIIEIASKIGKDYVRNFSDLLDSEARVRELEKENARKAFRLGWIYDNYGDTTAMRFAIEADDSEIDEKMNSGEEAS